MKKQDPLFCCIQETHLSNKDRYYLRVKVWEKIFQESEPKKQAGVAILISNKIDFQPKLIKRDRKGCFILKGKNYQKKNLNSEHLCSKLKGTHISKRNIDKA